MLSRYGSPSMRKRWRRGALLIAPAVFVTAALRLAIPHSNDYSLAEALTTTLQLRAQRGDWNLYRFTLGTFGPLLIVPLLAPRANWRIVRPLLPFVALVYAQTLVATDTERLLIVACPLLILLVLNTFRVRFSRVFGRDPRARGGFHVSN